MRSTPAQRAALARRRVREVSDYADVVRTRVQIRLMVFAGLQGASAERRLESLRMLNLVETGFPGSRKNGHGVADLTAPSVASASPRRAVAPARRSLTGNGRQDDA